MFKTQLGIKGIMRYHFDIRHKFDSEFTGFGR